MILFVGALEIIWWLAAAWLTVGFLRAFVVLGQKPRESKLVQDLLGGLIYLVAGFAIIAFVFDLPVGKDAPYAVDERFPLVQRLSRSVIRIRLRSVKIVDH